MAKTMITVDGNTAAAHVAYAMSDASVIYPITPKERLDHIYDINRLIELASERESVRRQPDRKGLNLGINGFGRIGKLTVWHNVARKYFKETVEMIHCRPSLVVGTTKQWANPEIFRQYDISGFVGKDMTDHDVKLLDRGIVAFLSGQVIGRKASTLLSHIDNDDQYDSEYVSGDWQSARGHLVGKGVTELSLRFEFSSKREYLFWKTLYIFSVRPLYFLEGCQFRSETGWARYRAPPCHQKAI